MNLNQTFAILFRLNYSKANSKGLVPIWTRITIDGQRAECSTGKQVEPKHWDLEASEANRSCPEAKTINDHLLLLRTEINRHYNILLSSQEAVTAEDVKKSFQKKKERRRTFLELFRLYNEHLDERLKVNSISKRRHQKFRMLYGKCESFILAKLKHKDIFLDEVKLNFLVDFEIFLRTTDGVAPNTSNKNAKDVKQVAKYGISLGYLSVDPFINFKSTYKRGVRYYLDQKELERVCRHTFKIRRLEEVRDCYIFSCFTGYGYAEVEALRPSQISLGMDGEKWVMSTRTKTGIPENVPLLPKALEILNKYKNHPYCVKYDRILPVNSNQKYNSYLKEVAAVCKIEKDLTTHTARHTFATTVLLSNGVPIETAKELLGHTDIRTTQIYARVLQQKVSQDMKKLKKKLAATDREKKNNRE
jgi:integrase